MNTDKIAYCMYHDYVIEPGKLASKCTNEIVQKRYGNRDGKCEHLRFWDRAVVDAVMAVRR